MKILRTSCIYNIICFVLCWWCCSKYVRILYNHTGNHSLPSMKSIDKKGVASFSFRCFTHLARIIPSAPGPWHSYSAWNNLLFYSFTKLSYIRLMVKSSQEILMKKIYFFLYITTMWNFEKLLVIWEKKIRY